MSRRPLAPVSIDTFSIRVWDPTCWLGGSFILLVLCMLFVATPGLAVEPGSDIPAKGVDPSETPTGVHEATNQKRDASELLEIAAKLSVRTNITANLIVRDETRRLTEQLVRLDDETSTVADEISKRVDARLGTAMSKLLGNAYASATSTKDGEL